MTEERLAMGTPVSPVTTAACTLNVRMFVEYLDSNDDVAIQVEIMAFLVLESKFIVVEKSAAVGQLLRSRDSLQGSILYCNTILAVARIVLLLACVF